VEQQHFAIRKRTLDLDDVMNKQREIIYALRKDALLSDNPHEVLFSIIDQVIEELVKTAAAGGGKHDDSTFNGEKLAAQLNNIFPLNFTAGDFTAGIENGKLTSTRDLALQIVDAVENSYNERNTSLPEEQIRYLERHTVLEAIDRLWQEHLYAMDHLRSSMQLRVYAQKDPLVEYKHEAFGIFKSMMDQIYRDVAANLFRITMTRLATLEEILASMPQELVHQTLEQFEGGALPEHFAAVQQQDEVEQQPEVPVTFRRQEEKVGRNDLCPCGSGKKYKKCCGRE